VFHGNGLGNDLHLHLAEHRLQIFHRFAAPAEGPEGRADQVGRFQTLQVCHDIRHLRQHIVVERRRPHDERARFQHLVEHFAAVRVVHGQEFHPEAFARQRLGDGFGHLLRGMPHGRVHHHGLGDGLLQRPFFIKIENEAQVFAPHRPVVRRENFDRPAACRHFFQGFQNHRRIGQNDVGVVGRGFILQHVGGQLVGKPLECREVHAESVLRKENAVLFQPGKHGIRPVDHARFHKLQIHVAQGKRFAVPDRLDRIIAVENVAQILHPHGGGEHFFRPDPLDHLRQTAGVVLLGMVGDDIVDLRRIHHGGHARQHFLQKRLFHRVDERDFIRHHQIGVIGAAVGRPVTVKIADGPVDRPDPVNVFADLYCGIDVGHDISPGCLSNQ